MRLNVLGLTLIMAILASVPSSGQNSGMAASPLRALQNAQIAPNYGNLPLTFELNQGQVAPQAKFVSRGKGYSAFLTAGGMVLSLRPSDAAAQPTTNTAANIKSRKSANATLQFKLMGASRNPSVVGENLQPGRLNYFIGNDPTKWHRNVPTYGQVRYTNVYPGIDLVYYGNHHQLEYDFAVAPGADPRQIQFEIAGASQIALDSDGNLVLQTGSGELHFQSPVVYQESSGVHVPVSGTYVMNDSTHIGFQVAHYDASKPLVIDPVLVYSTYLGGSGDEQPSGIAVDSTGSVYLAGYTDSADFPLTTLGSTTSGLPHVFVAKLDPTGSNLIYADYIGGNSQDYGYALTLDSNNNLYVTGSTASSNFPMVNPYQGSYPGSFNAFLTKVSADGSSLLYSTYLGGNGSDQPSSMAIDNLGSIIVAGNTSSTNFPTANAYEATANANQGGVSGNYGFLTKFSPGGSSLIYSTYLGGNSNAPYNCGGTPCWPSPYNAVSGIAVDGNGNAYATGITNTYNFPTTQSSYLATNSTQQNSVVGFVSEFNTSGSLTYSTYFYESSGILTSMNAIAVDASGSAYVTGTAFSDGTFPVTSTSICDPGSAGFACDFAFVTKFDPTGSSLLYSTFLGANNNANPQSIALDANNDAYVLASTSSSAFSTVNGIESYSSGNDLLLVEIDPAANTELLATYVGANADEFPAGLVVDASDNLYVAGSTGSTDLPVTQGAYQTVLGGGTDAFVMKIGQTSAPAVVLTPSTLQYAALPVGSSSAAQTVLLRNMGSAQLSISSIATTGDFSETDNCGNSVPAAGSCTLNITFTPTAVGTRVGSVAIQDDAAGSSHLINLSGIGSGAVGTLTPANATFASQAVGASSAAQTLTFTNAGNSALSISNIQITGDYAQTNNCPASLAANSGCRINVTFAPTATGTRSGTLSVNDSATNSSQTVNLSGTGSDFGLAASSSSETIKAGATATYTLTVSSVGGSFTPAVALSCSGLPAQTSCRFSPSTVVPGSGQATVTLSISTAASEAELLPAHSSHNHAILAVWFQLQGMGLFGMVLAGSKSRSKKVRTLVLLALVIAGLLLMSGCAGGTGIGPQKVPGTTTTTTTTTAATTYTITVTGTAGSLQHSMPVTLTVQ